MLSRDELITLAKEIAITHGLDPALVCAVCEQESGWDPNATRFEPLFKARYVDPLGLSDIEATQRSTSWGLMQVMGEVARELGFQGDIPELLDPSTGIAMGCLVLNKKIARKALNVYDGLLAYNGGGNLEYAQQVIDRMPKYLDAPPAAPGVDNTID